MRDDSFWAISGVADEWWEHKITSHWNRALFKLNWKTYVFIRTYNTYALTFISILLFNEPTVHYNNFAIDRQMGWGYVAAIHIANWNCVSSSLPLCILSFFNAQLLIGTLVRYYQQLISYRIISIWIISIWSQFVFWEIQKNVWNNMGLDGGRESMDNDS